MSKKSFYIGWELPDGERNRLLALFPPYFPDVIAHHITRAFGITENEPLPTATTAVVVGAVDDAVKVQALVVEIDGSIRRPDGKIYHCTWSLDRAQGAKPVHSNDLIQTGYNLVPRIPFKIIPKLFQ